MCELLAIVVKFMLRSPILLSESTSENFTGAQRDDAKFRSFLRRPRLYEPYNVLWNPDFYYNQAPKPHSKLKKAQTTLRENN